MQHESAKCLGLAMQALQDAVLARGADATSISISQKLAHLSACGQDLLKRQSDLESSLEDRSIAERALRNVLAIKDAETARLRSEISRLRHTLQAVQAVETAENGLQDKQDLGTADECAAVLDGAGRQVLLDAAVTANQKPVAVLLQLESEVSACKDRISNLESELTAAAAEHASRMSDQQTGFLSKLEQLRQVHSEQLAAATADAAMAAKEQQQQQMQHEQQLGQLRTYFQQQQNQQQAFIESLQKQLQQLQHQYQVVSTQYSGKVLANSSEGTGIASTEVTPMSANTQNINVQASLVADCRDGTISAAAANSQVVAASEDSGTAAAPQSAVADTAALELMEGQLIRLSGTIKAHQDETRQLREALLLGAEERRQLQQRLQQLEAQHQQQQAAPRSAVMIPQACINAAQSGSKRGTGTGAAAKAVAPGVSRSSSSKHSKAGR